MDRCATVLNKTLKMLNLDLEELGADYDRLTNQVIQMGSVMRLSGKKISIIADVSEITVAHEMHSELTTETFTRCCYTSNQKLRELLFHMNKSIRSVA